MQYYVAVKGIIRREDGKILVLKRSAEDDHLPDMWETVGGGMDREETPQKALQREIFEETGLVVHIGSPFNVFTFVKDTGEFKVGITFLCDCSNDTVILSNEHSDFRWIEARDFSRLASIQSLYEEISNYAHMMMKDKTNHSF